MPKLSQETFAIIGVGIGLAALILTSTAGLRSEIRDVRTEVRADREAFQSHILRLTEQQGVLTAHIREHPQSTGGRAVDSGTPPAPSMARFAFNPLEGA